MRTCHQLWITLLAACLVATCWGCRHEATQQDADRANDERPAAVPEHAADVQPAEVDVPSLPLAIPKVELTKAQTAACLVQVGDLMPEAELPDLNGNVRSLGELRGEKLTVVFFWNSRNIYATTELEDLTDEIAARFAEKGVRVVGINEGDTRQAAVAAVANAGARFVNLLDAGGAYFAKVATEKIPRTYLLDAHGKILWFDMEYSRSTRRALQLAIEVALGETTPKQRKPTPPLG